MRPVRAATVKQLMLPLQFWSRNFNRVHIAASARKHGVLDVDVRHAVRWALRRAFQGDQPTRVLFIGTDRAGRLLEVVVLDPDTDDAVAIHAMPLREKFYRFL